MKNLQVSAIANGTVIDHIPYDKVFSVSEILNLDEMYDTVIIAANLKSNRLKKKSMIKIQSRYLEKEEVDKIALVAPTATVSIIKNYEVNEKIKISIPKEIKDLIICNNPKCITNNDEIETKFVVVDEKALKVRCYYCERYMKRGEIKLK